MIILHIMETRESLKMRGLSFCFPIYTKCSHRYYKKKEKVLILNQPREQAGFREGYSIVDHLQTNNQLIEKCNEFRRLLYIANIDHQKALTP